ncbi:unnamed protein product [Withania somnifera]
MAGQRNNFGKRMQSDSDYPRNDGGKRRNPTDEKDSNSIGPEDTVFRYLCPTGKIGSIIGVGGDIAKQLRSETNSKIRINETIPGCEERVVTIYSGSEETNVSGDTGDLISPAQDALFKVHDRVLAEELRMEEDTKDSRQISVRMLVPSDQIGCVIGKGGQVIQNLRSETGAQIRVLSSEHLPPCALNTDELLQAYEDQSPTIDATMRLQPRSSEKTEKESGDAIITTRLLVPSSRVGCLIGKGGSIVNDMRNTTRASIRILSKENLPKVASEDDGMVQITGDANAASHALLQILMRLRANTFEMEGAFAACSPGVSYVPMTASVRDGSRYANRDNRSRRHGYSSYSGGHDYNDLSPSDNYGGSQVGGGGGYAPYGVYSSGRPGSAGVPGDNPSAYGKSYGY